MSLLRPLIQRPTLPQILALQQGNRLPWEGGDGAAGGPPNAALYGAVAWDLRGEDVTLNGADVASWNDSSAFARHWPQGTAALQPAQSVGSLNGRNGVLFGGAASGEFLNGPSLAAAGLTAVESFWVAKVLGTGANERALFNCEFAGSNTIYPWSDTFVYASWFTTVRKNAFFVPATPLTNAHIFSMVSAPGQYTCWLNGTQASTTAVNTVLASSATPSLGKGDQGIGTYFNGLMWRWTTFSQVLTVPNRAAYTAALRTYYGTP